MRTVVDSRFVSEATEYRLRYRCEHCANFDGEGEACCFGFPTGEHRDRELRTPGIVVFCKAFEL